MKKNVGWAVVSAVVIGLLVWGASVLIPFPYSEWSFFIGLGLAVVLFYFSSSGGTLSKGATLEASEAVWKVQKENEMKTNVGGVFYGAVLYTVISFVVMIVTYF
ncbi:hypothetical protein QTG56_00205 [Rossellomorea sp. AcN35-11]|nr:hypothetical protein [Rossellomorea aquimaris]WJV29640.1 hypothetical protein QTG56_00205 [Rossellomorea sp. AcN35-11]